MATTSTSFSFAAAERKSAAFTGLILKRRADLRLAPSSPSLFSTRDARCAHAGLLMASSMCAWGWLRAASLECMNVEPRFPRWKDGWQRGSSRSMLFARAKMAWLMLLRLPGALDLPGRTVARLVFQAPFGPPGGVLRVTGSSGAPLRTRAPVEDVARMLLRAMLPLSKGATVAEPYISKPRPLRSTSTSCRRCTPAPCGNCSKPSRSVARESSSEPGGKKEKSNKNPCSSQFVIAINNFSNRIVQKENEAGPNKKKWLRDLR